MVKRRVALVTGAAGGIGSAFVEGLLEDGHSVVAVDVSDAGLSALRDKISEKRRLGSLLSIKADLTKSDFEIPLVEAVREEVGTVGILINNAGISFTNSASVVPPLPGFWESSAEQWRISISLHASAPMALCRLFVHEMVESGWGRIVNVTTSLGSMIRQGAALYGPSKAALEAFTSVIAKDLSGTGVTANVLVPGGLTNTNMVPADSPFGPQDMLQPEIMLPPLRWIISDEASDVTDRRFVAVLWDAYLTSAQAADKASAPAAWAGLGPAPFVPLRRP